MRPRTLIVSAADATYFPLLRDLVASLGALPSAARSALACFDLGLEPEQREHLANAIAHWSAPGWDLPVADAARAAHPELRALTVRPFLPRYFPGYDVYLWIDADAWVQRAYALDWLFDAAATGALAACTHADRAYRHPPDVVRWRYERARAYFDREVAARLPWERYYNSGVFALAADAPHWQAWADAFAAGLAATGGTVCCDQTALHGALLDRRLPAIPLPATCNWLCHLAAPSYDTVEQCLCEPYPPHQPLGIVHLTGPTKTSDPATADGRTRSLRYPGPAVGTSIG